ncbi:hypothetical protein PZN02_004147 [Sinorhizobium garamanticum]|uniref:Uncharacterized protein n=1 Tax=Sinorhizobium garamanticum TaxID=680247 RepID=A0ABY8DM03_9HYPH|nr:hypothetical protein [Sinorhizobium garamanticum]WEX90595.1 hypothetical protein PZN02_004147 [Sinorhizobium garamanticum]
MPLATTTFQHVIAAIDVRFAPKTTMGLGGFSEVEKLDHMPTCTPGQG